MPTSRLEKETKLSDQTLLIAILSLFLFVMVAMALAVALILKRLKEAEVVPLERNDTYGTYKYGAGYITARDRNSTYGENDYAKIHSEIKDSNPEYVTRVDANGYATLVVKGSDENDYATLVPKDE